MIYITLMVLLLALALALIVSIRLNYWLGRTEEPDLFCLAVSLERRASGSAHDLNRESLERIADVLKRASMHIDIALGRIPTPDAPRKLSATKLGKLHQMTASAVQERLIQLGYMVNTPCGHRFTSLGLRAGGEFRKRDSHDDGYFAWPLDLPLATGPLIIERIGKRDPMIDRSDWMSDAGYASAQRANAAQASQSAAGSHELGFMEVAWQPSSRLVG